VVSSRPPPTDILQKRTDSYSLKSRAVDIMRDRTKSFDYTRGVLRELESQVRDEIKRLGGNKPLEAIVDALSLAATS
jgi:geranylgeranyl diphosphate synthase type 3